MTADTRAIERLKWRSRRGLLELDLIFTRYWAEQADTLTEHERAVLDRALQLPDNDLLDMVMGRTYCPDHELAALFAKLAAE